MASKHNVDTPSPIDITYIGERKVVQVAKIAQVAAGKSHSLFLCEDSSVYSSGLGAGGRLGNGNTIYHTVGTILLI